MSVSAMKQALDLLETSWGNGHEDTLKHWNETAQVLRQAIAEAKKRKWVGLTNEEITDLFFDGDSSIGVKTMSASDVWRIKRTEYLLRGKNT